MKKIMLFSFLLGIMITGCSNKTINVDEIQPDNKKYHIETYEYHSDRPVDLIEKKEIDGKTYSLVSYEDKEISFTKGYDVETHTITKKNVLRESEQFPPNEMVNGNKYQLKNIEYTDGTPRKEILKQTVYYTDEIPKESIVEDYYDELSGQTLSVTYVLKDTSTVTQWISDLSVPITVFDYYAFNYAIGNGIVTATPDSIDISSSINDILAHNNMDPSHYRLYGAYWDGQPYDNNGIYQRNAIAYGDRLQYQYTSYYEADTMLPALNDAILTYERKTENPLKDVTVYERTLVYEHQWITPVLVSFSLIVLVIAFILLFLFKIKDHKKEEKNNV